MTKLNKHILTLPTLLFLVVALLCISTLEARTRTTRKNLQSLEVPVAVMDASDELLPDSLDAAIDPNAVTLKGYSKRASDSKESFFVTNNTKHRMSAIRLLLRYTTMNGEMLTQRTVTVPVSLKPGETKLVSVKSFDVQRLFYFYAGPKPRKQATPFKVAFRLTGYDIPVGN
jgi:hypothetical protein